MSSRSRTLSSRSSQRSRNGTVGAPSESRQPGVVDSVAERVRFAPHLPWRDEPLAANLGNRLAGRILGAVLVDNDANAALWAEAPARGCPGHA